MTELKLSYDVIKNVQVYYRIIVTYIPKTIEIFKN